MNGLTNIWNKLTSHYKTTKDVALVLSGGGARGWAHIGAIESIIEHGYNITSVAGTSMGALVGGVYAAGKMEGLKKIAQKLTRIRMLRIMGFSPRLDHIIDDDRVMELLDGLIGNINIEDLPIPYCCSASDLVSGEEKVFRKGSLKMAIRASISIPILFKPVCIDNHVYVDGSIHNSLPLNQVERKKGDLLFAVNVSSPDKNADTTFLKKYQAPKTQSKKTLWRNGMFHKPDPSSNFMNIAMRVTKLSIQNNTQMSMRLTPPDICVDISMDEFNLFDFDKATKLISYGHQKMDEALQSR
ncbi:MAG: patatin-like phospholipase family protein [Prevotella sp.]|jgi:NTE family protein